MKDIIFTNQFNDNPIANHQISQPINHVQRVLNIEIPIKKEFAYTARQDFAPLIAEVTCPTPAPALVIHVNYPPPTSSTVQGISTNFNPFLLGGYYYYILAGTNQFGYGAPEYFDSIPTPFLYFYVGTISKSVPEDEKFEPLNEYYYLVKTVTPFTNAPGDVISIDVPTEQEVLSTFFNTIFEE